MINYYDLFYLAFNSHAIKEDFKIILAIDLISSLGSEIYITKIIIVLSLCEFNIKQKSNKQLQYCLNINL